MKNKAILILLFAVFFAPVLIALLLNSQWLDWNASPDRAHGELLQPVVPIGPFALSDAAGQPRSLEDLAGRWQLIFTTTLPCAAECRETLLLLHNIRLAQDRRAGEAGLVLITDQILSPELITQLPRIDATWTLLDGTSGAALLQRFPRARPQAFFIVDPQTNIIERFSADADPTGIRKDLDRLLTWTLRE